MSFLPMTFFDTPSDLSRYLHRETRVVVKRELSKAKSRYLSGRENNSLNTFFSKAGFNRSGWFTKFFTWCANCFSWYANHKTWCTKDASLYTFMVPGERRTIHGLQTVALRLQRMALGSPSGLLAAPVSSISIKK